MKYKVTGSNRTNGARMTLDVEADSKAAAERKAAQSGMDVHHATPAGEAERSYEPVATPRRGAGRWLLLIVIVILVVVAYRYWPTLRGMTHR